LLCAKKDVDARDERGHDELDGFSTSWQGFVPAIHALVFAG
jgi:hypothetical protein